MSPAGSNSYRYPEYNGESSKQPLAIPSNADNCNGESSRQPTSGSNYPHGRIGNEQPSKNSSMDSIPSHMSGFNGESSKKPSQSPNSSILSSGKNLPTPITVHAPAPVEDNTNTVPVPTQTTFNNPNSQLTDIDAKALVIKNIPGDLSENEFRLLLENEAVPNAWAVDFLRRGHRARVSIAFANYHTEEDATAALKFLRGYQIGSFRLFVERKTIPRAGTSARNDLYLQNQQERYQAAVRYEDSVVVEHDREQMFHYGEFERAWYYQQAMHFAAVQQAQIEMERQRAEQEFHYQQQVHAAVERRALVLQRHEAGLVEAKERARQTLQMYQEQQWNDTLLAKKKKIDQASRNKEQEKLIKQLREGAEAARMYKAQYMRRIHQLFEEREVEFEKSEKAKKSKGKNVEGRF